MAENQKDRIVCQVNGKTHPPGEMFPLEIVHEAVFWLIQRDHPGIEKAGFICQADLNSYRMEFKSV